MLRISMMILSGNAVGSLLLFLRNLVLARMLSVSDFGVASTFAMILAVTQMASDIGLQKQIVQSKDGDDAQYQAGLQGFQLLRGLISGLILFLAAGVIAEFLGIPEVAWAYQLLAVAPILRALMHFDVYRLNRELRFGPVLLTSTIPAAATLLLTFWLVSVLSDWRVMPWLIIAYVAIGTIVSHIVADRPYRVRFDGAQMAGALKFGWPLLVNSALMFLIFQGDKAIVARELGMEALAIFAMGVTLSLTPGLLLTKSLQDVFLPKLSAANRSDPSSFARLSALSLQCACLAALALLVAIVLVGGPFVQFALGDKFSPLIPLLTWFALGQAFRVMKVGFGVTTISIGRTEVSMIANIARVLVLPIAWWALLQGYGIMAVLYLATAGEMIGFVVGILLMQRYTRIVSGSLIFQQVLVICLMAWIVWLAVQSGGTELLPAWVSIAGSLAALPIAFAAMPESVRFLRSRLG